MPNKFTVKSNEIGQQKTYDIEKNLNYITPELRALTYAYTDPFFPCFKLMIDYDKPYGLFANESYKDSALAYLKRLEGNSVSIRYNALKNWLENFKAFVKYWDFLMLEIDGLEPISIRQSYDIPDSTQDTDPITITCKETIDMRVFNLIEGYRNIAYDFERMCEVLPDNIRRFDAHIIVFPASYYSMALYSMQTGGSDNDIRKVLPTLDKVNDDAFVSWNRNEFNNVCFNLYDCEFDMKITGSKLFSSISNRSDSKESEVALGLNYRFANYAGIFNNTRGEINLVEALALASAQARVENAVSKSSQSAKNNLFKNIGQEISSSAKYGANSAWQFIKNAPSDIVGKISSRNGSMGNAFKSISPSGIGNMIRNTVDLGIGKVEDKYINSTLTRLNNLVGMNFNDNVFEFVKNEIISRFGKYSHPGNAKFGGSDMKAFSETPSIPQTRANITKDKGVTLNTKPENIFTRKGF